MRASTLVALLVLLLLTGLHCSSEEDAEPAAVPAPTVVAEPPHADGSSQGFLYGLVTSNDGDRYEGRLRFGGDEEAFWNHYFNGFEDQNRWASLVPPEQLTRKRPPVEILGLKISLGSEQIELGRPFMVHFGQITRIEAQGRDLVVTLKSGTVVRLDRFSADDFADGLRVWDEARGVVDLDEWEIRSIEFRPTPGLGDLPGRLHGKVRTDHEEFTGFVQWNRGQCLGSDELVGRTPEGDRSIRFETIRSIEHLSPERARVILIDGTEATFQRERSAGGGAVSIDDRRFGRVLVPWNAFERIDLNVGVSGPPYTEFPPGRSLIGTVTTTAGRLVSGKIVFDLDESETIETLDAPARGVDYSIPFGRIDSIVPAVHDEQGARSVIVTLHDGESVELERAGDLGEGNAGILVFVDGGEISEYVRWVEVERIDFDPSVVGDLTR